MMTDVQTGSATATTYATDHGWSGHQGAVQMTPPDHRRPEAEIRAEISRLADFIAARLHAKSDVEKCSAALMMQALLWVLSEIPSPSVRVRT